MTLGPGRMVDLLAPFIEPDRLSQVQINLIESHIALLLKWNSKINLTAIRNPEEIVTRHFGESLFAAWQLFPSGNEPLSAIDLGSGPGFPGIPFKIWNADLNLTLIEANQKKATFLREVVRTLDMEDAEVLDQRVESIARKADLVTMRAVEQFNRVLPHAGRLLNPSGRLALLISDDQAQAAKQFLQRITWNHSVPIPLSRNRVLLIGTFAK